jgi:serine O-acetyltransferase
MLQTFLEDLRAKAEWYETDSLLRALASDGTTATALYRAMRFCQRTGLKPLAAVLYRLNAFLGHAVIGRGAEFGPGLVILHSIGVVINSQVRAGRNVVIEHGVTIGAEKGQSPVLGDDVFIGAGAKIIGAVRIGSRVKIGANAVVTRDVPDGATVVGIPARVVRLNGRRVDSDQGPEARAQGPGDEVVQEALDLSLLTPDPWPRTPGAKAK